MVTKVNSTVLDSLTGATTLAETVEVLDTKASVTGTVAHDFTAGGGGGWGASGGASSTRLGGAGGKAVNLNGNTVTWLATGTRYGAIS